MINYNLVMYMGIAFYILVMIGFIILITTKRKNEIEIFKQGQLHKSFIKNKNKWKYYYT